MKVLVFLLAYLPIAVVAEVLTRDATLPVVNIHYDFEAQDGSALSKSKTDMANWEARAERLNSGIDRSARELNDFVHVENNVLEDATQVLKSPLLRGSATN
eukprot:TRINITY_DN25598_c0_g1_i2.p1 TRINITY_DN25598_c0_g1~~TRINITY_DN25598_c0_g1_i2.p1  ORF type:complete len:101 (+),score=19.24 TRINITY_DN25598_c0_g1_i2:70-372(+)